MTHPVTDGELHTTRPREVCSSVWCLSRLPFILSIKCGIINAQSVNCCRRKIAFVLGCNEANYKVVMVMQSQYALMRLW